MPSLTVAADPLTIYVNQVQENKGLVSYISKAFHRHYTHQELTHQQMQKAAKILH